MRVVTNGLNSIRESGRSLNISPGTKSFDDVCIVPLGVGVRSPWESLSKIIDMASKENSNCRVDGVYSDINIDGLKTTKITIENEVFKNEYWIDLDQGSIPVMTRSQHKKTGIYRVEKYQDITKIPGKGYFPLTWTYFQSQGLVQYISINAYEFDLPPANASFNLEFTSPTRLVDSTQGVVYPASRIWNLDELPSIDSLGVIKIAVGSQSLPKPSESDPVDTLSLGYRILLVVSLIFSIGMIFFFFIAFRKPSSTAEKIDNLNSKKH